MNSDHKHIHLRIPHVAQIRWMYTYLHRSYNVILGPQELTSLLGPRTELVTLPCTPILDHGGTSLDGS